MIARLASLWRIVRGEDQRARQRDPLPLATREREPALADRRLVSLRQALDEVRQPGAAAASR